MMVEITEVKIAEDKISIIATDLENILLADNLYEDINEESVEFEFDRHARNGAAMKYLYKVRVLCPSCAVISLPTRSAPSHTSV